MSKYRKKPIVVDANQWFGSGNHHAVTLWKDHFKITDPRADTCLECGRSLTNDHGWVYTLEGGHIVCPGDWIITGVKGEYYPCKPDIFEATYEPMS